MQVKRTLSVALFLTVLLLGQAMTGHLNQILGIEQDSTLESTSVVMASNSTNDTDGDGIDDTYDSCPNGNTNWTSMATTDWDADGCQDSMEDTDDDNDGVLDAFDDCPLGDLGWTSSSVTDYDSDGCRDASEDMDDDNDGVSDVNDACSAYSSDLGWTSSSVTDYDSDGCRDAGEDTDDDNDGVVDVSDSCPKGDLGWISSSSTDADGDGCRDSTEDFDTTSWSTPVSLDSRYAVGYESSLAIDSNDNLHVTYFDGANGNLEYMTYDGSSWSTPVSLDSTDLVGYMPSLAIDSDDDLHVTYLDNTNDNLEYVTYDGSSWSTPVSLDSTDSVGHYSSLAIDSNDNLHVTYFDATNEALEYMTYDGSSWSTPVSLDSRYNVGHESSLAIDLNDNLHVIYIDEYNGSLEYMTYNGSSWSTPVSLDNRPRESSLAIDSNDNLHVTYFQNSSGNLEYMTYDGSSWSTPVSLDSIDLCAIFCSESSLAIDSNDNLHVTYLDFTNDNLEYVTYDGSSWSTPLSLDSTDDVGYQSSLAIDSNDILHVTYFDGTNLNLEYMTTGTNTGGNNSGGNITECLTFTNLSFDYNYSAAPQDSFNLTADLTNTCAEGVLYPNTVVVFEQEGINVTNSNNWRYGMGGNNSSYPVSWQVSRDSTFGEGEMVVFEIHPSRDNCYENCTESQNYNYTVELPFGLIDLHSCYTIGNITDDYSSGMTSFNLSADLITDCLRTSNGGLLHYPWADLQGDFINGTYAGYGEAFYAMGLNSSNPVQWSVTVPSNLTNGTVMTYSLAPTCAWVTMTLLWPSENYYNAYNQNCDDVGYDEMYHSVVVINSNFSDGNNTGGNNTGNATNPCGNPSPLTFSNTSSAYAVNQSVTFILTIDCVEGDDPFAIFGAIDSGLQGSFMVDWGIPGICDYCWNSVQSGQSQIYYHIANWDTNHTGYEITLTLSSGQQGIQGEYIVEASLALEDNVSSNITWNFTVYEDNDADGVSDATDNCPNGTSNWTSTTVTDYDSDGCQDSSEDTDDDNDGVNDVSDSCMKGDLGWTSSTSTDYDGDGCKDSMEDLDDDADGIPDANDNCPLVANADQADLDGDGIGSQCDASEVSIDEGSDCVFSDVNYEPTTEVIFYLSWTDSDGVNHCGTLQFELYSAEAPIHVQNFQDHVEAGNYNGTVYHRIIDGFMIQSGDFEYGNGMGGYAYSWHGYCNGQVIPQSDCELSDYSIPDEFNSNLEHTSGALSMAKTALPNTGGSQFFIVDAGSTPSHLDGVHTIFGQAIAGTIDGVEVTGIEVVDAISQVEVSGPSSSSPIYDVTIIGAENIVSTQTPDNEMIEEEPQPEPIPSIGMVGTVVAISAGFFIAIRREDEE